MKPKILTVFTLVAVLAVTGGCSGGGAAGRTVSGWFDGGKSSPGSDSVRYAGQSETDVLSKPEAGSKTVARLSAHEKVVQTGTRNGYAKIRARSGAIEGWVPASKLVGRPPKARASAVESRTGDAPPDAASEAGAGNAAAEIGPADSSEPTTSAGSPDAAGDTGATASDTPAASPSATTPAPVDPHRPHGVGASVFDPY